MLWTGCSGGWRCNNDDVFWAHGALAVLDRFARGGPTRTTDDPGGEWTGDIGVRTGEVGEVTEGGLFQVIKKNS